MPFNLRFLAFPQQPLPEIQNESAKRPSEGTNGVVSPPPKRKAKGTTGPVDVDDDSLPATQRVQALFHGMGLKAPSYVLTPADERVNYIFNGHPDFGDDEDTFGFDEDLGRITRVSGRDNAKQQIAEKLLPRLLEMRQERKEFFESHLRSTGT